MHGFWGLICADGWDYRDAKIACQQLGYNGCKVTYNTQKNQCAFSSYPLLRHSYDKDIFANFDCDENIALCINQGSSYCAGQKSAGVICTLKCIF